jgi:acyl CoA:acetate/3-ketoacid CoA transferase alpha subunit/acyl CoA:acetate/3-ketoacid CoA transferase beta subunit
MQHLSLADAVEAHTRPGDSLQVFYGHSRWTAVAREVCRQFWRSDPGFELQFVSCGNLGTLFVHGGLVRKIVTTYAGDGFPTGGPNPVYTRALREGLEIEHWSILTFQQRNEAAARGLPAAVTASLRGTDMESNSAYKCIDTPFGEVGLLAPLECDVVMMHAPVADAKGNVALTGPLMEGLWAAWSARRGAIVSVDKVVDDLSPWNTAVRLPAHRVLAVVEAPFGAHPGGVYAGDLPTRGYGEDIPFWNSIAAASRGDFDAWIADWVLAVHDQQEWNARVGSDRLEALVRRTAADSWQEDASRLPLDEGASITKKEVAAAICARELSDRIKATGADAVLAGAGLSNLAAWAGVTLARREGRDVRLAAEMGMWGYEPTPADPYIFNHRSFPTAEMLTDVSWILGTLVSGPGSKVIGAMTGAEVDRFGNINSTDIPGTQFVAGSGGGADVAARCDEVVLALVASRHRLVERCAYLTSPGERVQTVCTDLGILRKRDGELRLAGVVAGKESLEERVRAAVGACGWPLLADREITEIPYPSPADVLMLRNWDRERILLS